MNQLKIPTDVNKIHMLSDTEIEIILPKLFRGESFEFVGHLDSVELFLQQRKENVDYSFYWRGGKTYESCRWAAKVIEDHSRNKSLRINAFGLSNDKRMALLRAIVAWRVAKRNQGMSRRRA